MAEYTEYHPLRFWLDPASIAEIVAHIQTYLVNNPINSTTEIETIIHDYLIAHPELIGGVDSVNGLTGEVVLTADNISGGENVTIKDVLDSLQDQIDDIVASIPSDYQQLIDDVSDLRSAINDKFAYIGNFAKFTVNGTYNVPFDTVSGHTYKVTNLSGASVSIKLRETFSGSGVQTVSSGLAVGTSIRFTSNQNTAYISGWCLTSTVFEIIDTDSQIENYNNYGNDIRLLGEGKYPLRLISGGFIQSDGTVSVNQYYSYSDYIDCTIHNAIRIVTPSGNLRYCCWYNSSKEKISTFTVAQGDVIKTAPEGAKYCRISDITVRMQSVYVNTSEYFDIKDTQDYAEGIYNSVESLNDGYLISNDLLSVEWEQGNINKDDEETSSSYYVRSKYLYVGNLKGLSYIIATTYYVMWHTYDIEKTVIDKHRTYTNNAVIPIDDNVAFIRLIVCGDKNQVSPSNIPDLLTIIGINKFGLSIPDYWLNHLNTKIATVRGLQKTCGSRGDEFVYITDYHDTANGYYNSDISPSMIERVMRKTSARFVVFGGDGFDHESTIGAYREGQYNFYDQFYFLKAGQFFPVIGNHEFYSDLYTGTSEDEMTAAEAYNINLKRYEDSFVDTDYLKSYCFDNRVQKIRYFVLGCDYNSNISSDQITWLLNQLLELPAGYSVFLITHSGTYVDQSAPTTPIFNSWYQTILDALNALKSGYSVTYNDVEYDFSSKQRTVICALSGHTHIDMSTTTSEGIPVVVRAADKINVNRTKGTADEHLFDVVNIDMTNRKIYFTRIGAGNSADFSY